MPFKCIQLVFAGNVQAQTQNTFVSEYRGKLKLKKSHSRSSLDQTITIKFKYFIFYTKL